ncbi:hypothetical protein QBC42DRAFT_321971 [Cladorrhinum samala]|uniref:BRCT domain-containing protein n=1 Tax=Cladorrhinum samala TaxID=585594 RepID=A0AAV9H7Y4_9PEZI|nr:hypothetical protein QBC42DRAFT_321971 [Cladorrhinum samala]
MPGPRSPLKRVTRARAAAKVVGPGTKTAKAVTAAAKAKAVHSAAASTSAPSTSTTTTTRPLKRKSPSDEDEAEDHEQPERKQAMLSSSIGSKPARGRGRPKKAETQPEPALPSSTRGRGRPKKADETATAAPAPVRPIKATRAKKTAPATEITVQPSQKTTRTRPAMAATAGTAARAPGRPALKKTVKFEEPEKENIAPAPAARASTKASTVAAGGLRGKPVRKAAGAATRTTRTTKASGAAENEDKPLPLSPKKVNQLSMNRSVESDDELAMDDKVPVGPLKKAPVKAVMGATKALKSSIDQKPSSSTVENDENALMGGAPEANLTLMLGTPAKRLPASPWKGSIKSAARRVEGLFGAPIPTIQEEGQASQVPVKMGLLNTPAKRHPLSIPISFGVTSGTQPSPSPFKFSLLSSPAKRSIMSPIKSLPPKIEEEEEEPRSPAPKPTLLASPVTVAVETADEAADVDAPADEDDEMIMVVEEEEEDEDEDNAMPDSPSRAPFPGRLSAVLPRHADPALPDNVVLEEGEDEEEMEEDSAETIIEEVEVEAVDGQGERMVLDLDSIEVKTYSSPASSPNTSPERPVKPPFGLREKDLNPYGDDTDSEEEATRQFVFTAGPATPSLPTSGTPSTSNQPTRSSARNAAKRMKVDSGLGFTPLASQLGQWTAGPSPLKTGISAPSPSPVSVPVDIAAHEDVPTPGAETTRSNFFEEEMLARPDAMQVEEEEAPVFQNEEIETPILEDVSFTEEDVALAAEANEMSLMEPEQIDDLVNTSNSNHDDTVSEASQEYGDENAIPVDSHVLPNDEDQALNIPPATPARVLRRREVHTVAKVPLKPADDSTPKSKLRKRHSISRVPVSRSTRSTTRNAAATSYEPTKGCEEDTVEEDEEEEGGSYIPPVTPDKEDIWAAMGTPARTPHKNLSPALLRGAVVFVDVYTSEGAEASGIFVELLNQMGARCIKDWKWNPDSSDSKIGITHVVYKDGGKRTLEKVRLSRGVVQCVGVSWVLE